MSNVNNFIALSDWTSTTEQKRKISFLYTPYTQVQKWAYELHSMAKWALTLFFFYTWTLKIN